MGRTGGSRKGKPNAETQEDAEKGCPHRCCLFHAASQSGRLAAERGWRKMDVFGGGVDPACAARTPATMYRRRYIEGTCQANRKVPATKFVSRLIAKRDGQSGRRFRSARWRTTSRPSENT